MIIHLKSRVSRKEAIALAAQHQAIHFNDRSREVLVLAAKIKEVPTALQNHTDASYTTDTDIQLASKSYQSSLREITIGDTTIGGETKNTLMIAGPCAVESPEQVDKVAQVLKKLDVTTFRAGCFKPRTSPYTFQGLGEQGLKILANVRDKYGFNIITEVKDSSHIDMIIEYADIVQIGAKAMYDHSIGKRCGQTKKPILLKRGFGTTLQEFIQAAEFILSGGNPNVILCERGIRTFEMGTRFTLDLCGVALIKEKTNLPVVVDPSHAMGYRYGVADLTRAAIAMGVDGLLVETHPSPATAKSDAAQQLDLDQFQEMYHTLQPIARVIGRRLI